MRGSECLSGPVSCFSGLGGMTFLHEFHTGSNSRMARRFERTWENRRAQFGVKNESIAILFDRLGPYHWARLQAAARLFRVVAVETYAITREYQWEGIDEPRAFDRITLFDDVSEGRNLKRGRLRQKLAKALREAEPAVALIPGWATPASLIALEWCLRNRRPAVVMSESNAFDEKRYALAELIK